jgi:hypothetical protein
MANIYLQLLEEFEPTGLASRKSISSFMESHFTKPTTTDYDTFYRQDADSQMFLQNVKQTGHFSFDESEVFNIGYNHTTHEYRWYDVVNIHARITIEGLEYLEKHKTNKTIVANSTHQNTTLDRQTAILRSQRKYLYMTVAFAGISALTAILSYVSSMSTTQLSKQLQSKTQQIHTLQIELSQATNRHFQELEAKKISPKKN